MILEDSPRLVRDLMTVGVETCSLETPVKEIARLLVEKNLEAVVVLDKIERHALGMVGREELVEAYTRPGAEALKAEDVMRDGVPQVPADIPLIAAAQLMQDQGLRVLFVMHQSAGIEYPAASLSYWHILRHLAAGDPGELKDLGMSASRQLPLELFVQRREAARKKNSSER